MKTLRMTLLCCVGWLVAAALCPAPLLAQTTPNTTQPAQVHRDGQHDFDFNFGTWHTHIKRLLHPLSGAHDWTELEGTVTVHKVWNGKGSMEEIEASGPNGRFEGMTLFLYNPVSHQWSQTFANSSDGTLSQPAIGEFKDGRGELIDQEPYHGRMILVRTVWSGIKPDSHHLEQSFSDDNGRTWEPNFVADLIRIKS